jgi:hypothetical protein
MDCLTCEQLTAEFERLERRCAEARARMSELYNAPDAREYNRAKVQANEAWLDSEVARIELEKHERTHPIITP